MREALAGELEFREPLHVTVRSGGQHDDVLCRPVAFEMRAAERHHRS